MSDVIDRNEGAGEDPEPDVEAHGLREVMSIGLAATALAGASAGAPAAAKAADTSQRTTIGAIATTDLKELDPYKEYTLGTFEAAGYTVDLDELARAGYKASGLEIDSAGYAVSLDELERLGQKDGSLITLKWGVDEEFDAVLDKLDQANQYSLGEFVELGYDVSTDQLESSGIIINYRELDELGFKMSWHDSAGLKESSYSAIELKRGVDADLDVLLEKYGAK